MKYRIRKIGLLFLLCFAAILLLLSTSGTFSKPANHFKRRFVSNMASLRKAVDIEYNSYYIAGVNSHRYYIGNEGVPLLILICDTSLINFHHLTISNMSANKIKSGTLSINPPYFYLSDQLGGAIYRGSLGIWKASVLIRSNLLKDAVIPLGSNSFVVRALQKRKMEYVLDKEFVIPDSIVEFTGLLEKQIDGVFSSDGMLMYDPIYGLLVYVYAYRNQFICMDTNLSLLYRGSTIDTNTRAKIKLARIRSENEITLSKPPLVVNRESCLFDHTLFVNSELMADNENKVEFDRHIVVDVYDMMKGDYKYSFYIPKYKNNKLKDFRVSNDRLIAIADHYLLEYELNYAEAER